MKNLRELSQGATFFGLGSAVNFFFHYQRPIEFGTATAVFPLIYNYIEGDYEAVKFNLGGIFSVNILSFFLKEFSSYSQDESYFIASMAIFTFMVCLIMREENRLGTLSI